MTNHVTNFEKLESLLSQGNWHKADQETGKIMLKIMGREKEGSLTFDDCINFPHEEYKKNRQFMGEI